MGIIIGSDRKKNDRSGRKYLSINGEVDLDTFSFGDNDFNLTEGHTLDKLSELTIKELRQNFDSLYIKCSQSTTDWYTNFQLILKQEVHDDSINFISLAKQDLYPARLHSIIIANARTWNKLYTINEVIKVYQGIFSNMEGLTYYPPSEDLREVENIGEISIEIKDESLRLHDILIDAKNKNEQFREEAKALLQKNILPDLLTTVFEFPEEIKTACKQYLIYFTQFLSDLGINAETSINEEANKVLFTVIPKDGNEALDKIKEALELFINAPGNPDAKIISSGTKDIAVLQWEANIYHLKSQIVLQQAVLQAKDATIEALQLSNYRLKEEVTTAKQIEEKGAGLKEEKFMGGVVSVKKYEGKGFSIDFPSLIRKLKRKK